MKSRPHRTRIAARPFRSTVVNFSPFLPVDFSVVAQVVAQYMTTLDHTGKRDSSSIQEAERKFGFVLSAPSGAALTGRYPDRELRLHV